MRSGRGRGERAGLTQRAVLDAAHALVAEEGLDELTMRALATQIGVAPNAIYSYVSSKDALLDELLDDLLSRVDVPTDSDPLVALRKLTEATYQILVANPKLVPGFVLRQGARGPNARRLGAAMDNLLQRAGVPQKELATARTVLIVYIIGFASLATPTSGAVSEGSNFRRGLRWLIGGIGMLSAEPRS